MNLQKLAMGFSLILLSGAILSGFAIQDVAFAQQRQGMELSLTADKGSTTITVSGITAVTNNDISIVVMAPNGNIVSIDQVSPEANGDFMTEIQTGSFLKQDGAYTVTAQQGPQRTLYKISLLVEIVGGTTLATAVSDSSLVTLSTGGSISIAPGLTMEADFVRGSTSIDVIGQTDRTKLDISFVITAPNGNIISVDQVTPNVDGSFMVNIQTGGDLWDQDGFYTVSADQGVSTHQDSVQVEIDNGVVIPEFDTIAAMILSVAIISIIAVTAKTRLRLVPRH
jgi:predicted secreted protein with PEFG-CTERM motif